MIFKIILPSHDRCRYIRTFFYSFICRLHLYNIFLCLCYMKNMFRFDLDRNDRPSYEDWIGTELYPWPYGGIKYKQQCTLLSWMFFLFSPLSSVKYCRNCSSMYAEHAFQVSSQFTASPKPRHRLDAITRTLGVRLHSTESFPANVALLSVQIYKQAELEWWILPIFWCVMYYICITECYARPYRGKTVYKVDR